MPALFIPYSFRSRDELRSKQSNEAGCEGIEKAVGRQILATRPLGGQADTKKKSNGRTSALGTFSRRADCLATEGLLLKPDVRTPQLAQVVCAIRCRGARTISQRWPLETLLR